MDIFARGLEKAFAVLDDGRIPEMLKERYSSFKRGNGKKFADGKMTMEELAELAAPYEKVASTSGKQELYENIMNEIILG